MFYTVLLVLVTIPGKGHEILDDPAVESAVEAAARER
jgi:hypothetical protein